jgi:hypothetical protein
LYLFTPFILPISFYVRPAFCGILLAATVAMYLINTVIFNEVHLRRKNERIGWFVVYVYYLPYKIVLTGVNVASCYWYVNRFYKNNLEHVANLIRPGLSTSTPDTLPSATPRSPKTRKLSKWSFASRKTPKPRPAVWAAVSPS